MYNAPYAGVADQLAKFGRYGDSELVHLNPIEVQMLASLSPTGQLTVNPMTGRKEAFLPFLAPLLGSFLGSSLLTGTGAALLGGAGLSSAAAGAIGSGLATAAVTGDLEQGIMSGLTGFGLGQAFGAAGNAAAKAGTDAATQGLTEAATQGVQSITPDALNIQPLSAGTAQAFPTSSMATAPMESFLPISQQANLLSQNLAAPTAQAATTEPVRTAADLTATQRMAAPFTQSGTLLSELASPGSFLPMYVGETGRMAREQELMGRGSMEEYEAEQKKQRDKTLQQMGDVFNQIRRSYPGVGYAQGGMIDRYAVGGGVENAIRQAAQQAGYGGEYGDFSGSLPYNIPDPKSVQLSLRGSQFVPPPASSYSALDVGGEGYLAGMAPEFQYFREPPPPPTGYVPPPPGTVAGGGGGVGPGDGGGGGGAADIMGGTEGFDFGNFLSGFRGIQNIYGRPGGGVDTGAGPVAGREPIGTGITEPMGPEDFTMYPGGSATFDETAGAGAGIPAGGEFDTSILQDLLNQQANTPTGGGYPSRDEFYGNTQTFSQTEPETFPANPPLTQPNFPAFTGFNMADLEQRLAELAQNQNAPVATENTTQYDPTRGAQTFETPQVTFDTQPISAQPEVPVSRPAMPTRFEPEPEVTRGIGAFREPAVSYTPPEVYRSPQPVEIPPELPVAPPPVMRQPEPVVQPPPAPVAPAPAARPRAARREPTVETPPVARAPEPVAPTPVAAPPVMRQPEPVFQAPPVQAPPIRETPPAMRPTPISQPSAKPSLQELISNARGSLSSGLNRPAPVAPPVAEPMPVAPPPQVMAPPVAPPPVAVPSFDPQLLEQLIAMSRSPEALPQQDMGFAMADDISGPFGRFSSLDDGRFAEGGMVNETDNAMGQENSIVDMTVAAIRGEIDNADQIIRQFVEMYGPEVFMQLREQVLQEIVPGAQTNGMVEGEGGGQDDLVNGMIGTQRPVAVSPGEYIIPADVVSLAGGGYSGDGAKYFDGLIDDIRQKTMGTKEQIRPYRSA